MALARSMGNQTLARSFGSSFGDAFHSTLKVGSRPITLPAKGLKNMYSDISGRAKKASLDHKQSKARREEAEDIVEREHGHVMSKKDKRKHVQYILWGIDSQHAGAMEQAEQEAEGDNGGGGVYF